MVLDGCGRDIVKPDDFDKFCLVRSTSEYERDRLEFSRLNEYVIAKMLSKRKPFSFEVVFTTWTNSYDKEKKLFKTVEKERSKPQTCYGTPEKALERAREIIKTIDYGIQCDVELVNDTVEYKQKDVYGMFSHYYRYSYIIFKINVTQNNLDQFFSEFEAYKRKIAEKKDILIHMLVPIRRFAKSYFYNEKKLYGTHNMDTLDFGVGLDKFSMFHVKGGTCEVKYSDYKMESTHNQMLTEALAEVVCEMINENPIIHGEKTFINCDSVQWYHCVTISTPYPAEEKTEAKKTGWLD